MTILGPVVCIACRERVKVAIGVGTPILLDERLEKRHRCEQPARKQQDAP